MKFSSLKEGQRVRIKSINAKGRICYIDWVRIHMPEMYPVQVALDKPYRGGSMYRASGDDLVKLKKEAKSRRRD